MESSAFPHLPTVQVASGRRQSAMNSFSAVASTQPGRVVAVLSGGSSGGPPRRPVLLSSSCVPYQATSPETPGPISSVLRRGLSDRDERESHRRSTVQEVREPMNANLTTHVADHSRTQQDHESEAARLARSIRRARARTLAHNRRVLSRARGLSEPAPRGSRRWGPRGAVG